MKLKLVEKRDEAEGTKSFFWEPENEVPYLPGQYYYFTLPELKYPDPRGSTRHFTLSSSPTEGKLLRLTTKIREQSGFKKTLDELPTGTLIDGEGPNGTFILEDKNTGPHIFIAGGIGITPFRSMIKNVSDKNLHTEINLIYSNSTSEEITFRKELSDISSLHKNIQINLTISHPEESSEQWNGNIGRIDENLIKKLVSDIAKPTWWICGPPPMIDAMEVVLGKMGITSDRIRSEKFTGY